MEEMLKILNEVDILAIFVSVLIWIRVLISNFLGLCLNLCYCVVDIVLMFKWVCVLKLILFMFLSLCVCVP